MKIVFTASLPPILSSINIDGMGDGARIKLDIPATEMDAVLLLQTMTGKVFKVTIEEYKQNVVKRGMNNELMEML